MNSGSYDAGGTFLAFTDGNGTITFNNASVHADVLKVGALGTNGVLNIGAGTLSGDTTLKLYASGSNGRIDFVSNATLNSESNVLIAANTVTINNGIVVTITGDDGADAFVFTKSSRITPGRAEITARPECSPVTVRKPFRLSRRRRSMIRARRTPLPKILDLSWNQCSHSDLKARFYRGNRGGGADTINPRSRGNVTIARVTDSNELLDLADKVTSGPIETDHSKSKAPAGKTSRSPGSALSRKGRPLSPAGLTPADLALARSGVRRPAALP